MLVPEWVVWGTCLGKYPFVNPIIFIYTTGSYNVSERIQCFEQSDRLLSHYYGTMLTRNCPRWWYTIESTTSKHLISQFKMAIEGALASKKSARATMRARSAKQRFPIAQWQEDLSIMQDTAIRLSQKAAFKQRDKIARYSGTVSGVSTPSRIFRGQWSMPSTAPHSTLPSALPSVTTTRATSPVREAKNGPLSLGLRFGPGHVPARDIRKRNRLSKSRAGSRTRSIGPRSGRSTSAANTAANTATNTAANSRAGSRASSPVGIGRFRRRSRSRVQEDRTLSMTEHAPDMPPLPEDVMPEGSRKVSRFTEGGHGDLITDPNNHPSQGNITRFDFGNLDGNSVPRQFTSGSNTPFGARTPGANSTRRNSMSGDEYETDLTDVDERNVDEYILSPEERESSRRDRRLARLKLTFAAHQAGHAPDGGASLQIPTLASRPTSPGSTSSSSSSPPGTPRPEHLLIESGSGSSSSGNPDEPPLAPSANYLSLGSVLQGKKDYKLQSVEPFFTDPTGLYYNAFDKKLEKLNGKTSEGPLCIEDYLTSSEKDWFNRFRNVKMGKSAAASPASSVFRLPLIHERMVPSAATSTVELEHFDAHNNAHEQYLLNDDYKPPTRIKKLLLRRIGEWPLYSFLLAFVSQTFYFPNDLRLIFTTRVKSSRRIPIKSLYSQARSARQQRSSTSLPLYTLPPQSFGGLCSAHASPSTFLLRHLPSMG